MLRCIPLYYVRYTLHLSRKVEVLGHSGSRNKTNGLNMLQKQFSYPFPAAKSHLTPEYSLLFL